MKFARGNKPQYVYYAMLSSGAATGLVFTTGLPGILLPILLVPMLHNLSRYISQNKSHRSILLLAASFFVPYHAVVLSWFLDTNISGLLGVGREVAALTAIASWMLGIVVITLPVLVVMALIKRYKYLPTNAFFLALAVSSMWVLVEWTRSVWFSIFLYGSEATIGDYWNFGSLGLGIINTPLGYLGRLTGMYGLSFVTVFLAVALCALIRRQNYVLFPASVGIVTIGAVIGYGGFLDATATETLPRRNASVLQNEKIEPQITYNTLVENKTATKKDLIVLPEYSKLFEPEYQIFAARAVNERLTDTGVSIDVSKGVESRWFGTLEFRNSQGNKVAAQTKELLIPTGEYFPSVFKAFFTLAGQSKIVDDFENNRQVYKGTPPKVHRTDELIIGPVACSGILGRNIFRDLTHQGAEVLTNSASLIDFQFSKSYSHQSQQMARFHAVANSRPFVQASLGAPAFVLDHQGTYIVAPTSVETKFIDFSFQPRDNKTLYTAFGEWVLVASGLVLVVLTTNQSKRIRYLTNKLIAGIMRNTKQIK